MHYAALAHRGRIVATEKRQVRFTDFVEFSPPISLQQIQNLLDSKFQSYFVRSSTGMGARVPPKTWQALIKIIKHLRPQSQKAFERLEKLRNMKPEFFSRPGIENLAEERDAVNLALRVSDFDKEEILKWSPPEGDDLLPFLQGVESVKLIEDQMVAPDMEVFGDWRRLERNKAGTAVFEKGGERLSIMNVNRHTVEKTFGVDLFYYHYRYNLYVMVQYKRMLKSKETSEAVYRLGEKSYEAELQRMRELERILAKTEQSLQFDLNDYRLHPGGARLYTGGDG